MSNFSTVVALDLLRSVLTDGQDALLAIRWRRDGITVRRYGIEYVKSRDQGRMLIWAVTSPEMAARLKTSTLALLNELAHTSLAQEKFAVAQKQLAVHYLMDNEGYDAQADTLCFFEGMRGYADAERYLPTALALSPAQLRAATPTTLLAWLTLGHAPKGH